MSKRMTKAAPFLFLFLAVFGGVFGGMWVYEKFTQGAPGASSLNQLVKTQPVSLPKATGQIAFESAAKKLLPSVVSVFRRQASFMSEELQVSGQGSGVILTQDGFIITNYHVVEGAQAVDVRLGNGRSLSARIVGLDQISDLALLKLESKGLPAADLADSDSLEIGEWVLAVGSPLGFESTLSVGVVSAKNRDLPGGGRQTPLVGAIQTDAAINQGNSGGALANVHGQVVGINTQIASTTGGSIGIGFAIPTNRVKRFVSDIQKYGRARHTDLGVQRFGRSEWLRDPRFEQEFGQNPPGDGLVIYDLAPQSPLAKAGLGRMDVITEIDGVPMAGTNDYLLFLLKSEIGQKATVKYWQRGETKTASVVLEEMRS
jgi:S1-C subfamily serine protease